MCNVDVRLTLKYVCSEIEMSALWLFPLGNIMFCYMLLDMVGATLGFIACHMVWFYPIIFLYFSLFITVIFCI